LLQLKAPVIELNTDIVLSGIASWHDGDSDYLHWPDPIVLQYGRTYPSEAVVIQGNTFVR
jgi:hypothetical protein